MLFTCLDFSPDALDSAGAFVIIEILRSAAAIVEIADAFPLLRVESPLRFEGAATLLLG